MKQETTCVLIYCELPAARVFSKFSSFWNHVQYVPVVRCFLLIYIVLYLNDFSIILYNAGEYVYVIFGLASLHWKCVMLRGCCRDPSMTPYHVMSDLSEN